METIVLALIALSNFTGFSGGNSYETTPFHHNDAIIEHFGGASKKEISSIVRREDVYNSGGENEYLLYEFDTGAYSLYSKKEKRTIKAISTWDKHLPFEGKFMVYFPFTSGLGISYFDDKTEKFVDMMSEKVYDCSAIRSHFKDKEKNNANEYYKDVPITSNVKKINNSFYFERLKGRHGSNTKGTCTVVAIQILLGYFDTFHNDNLVPENYDVVARESISACPLKITDFAQSSGTDDPENGNNNFHDYLVKDVGKNELNIDFEHGATHHEQMRLIRKYLEKRNLLSDFDIETSEGNCGDVITGRTKNFIKNAINNNRPIIANGLTHSAVAFAYDDEYVWVHTGWGYIAATPWKTYVGADGCFWLRSPTCIDMMYTGSEFGSDNYFSTYRNVYVSPSGKEISALTINPKEYNFDKSISYEQKRTDISLRGISFRCYGRGAHYLEEGKKESISLLPPPENDKEKTFFQCWFISRLRKIRVNIDYNCILSELIKNRKILYFDILKYREWERRYYWVEHKSFTSKDIDEEKNIFFYCSVDEPVWGFRLRIEPNESHNRGKLSITLKNVDVVLV